MHDLPPVLCFLNSFSEYAPAGSSHLLRPVPLQCIGFLTTRSAHPLFSQLPVPFSPCLHRFRRRESTYAFAVLCFGVFSATCPRFGSLSPNLGFCRQLGVDLRL